MEVNVKINANCQLVAMPVDDLLEDSTVFVEFLINPTINNNDTIKISKTSEYYSYDLPKDGLYVYHKLRILDKAYTDSDYIGLCYDSDEDTLFFNGSELKNIFDILPYLDMAEYGIIEYVKTPMFSICKLQHCLKELQKKSILQCNKGLCDEFSADKKTRDFLFISIYVLEHLINQERFGEAIDILESLSSCVPICDNVSINKSRCNCK